MRKTKIRLFSKEVDVTEVNIIERKDHVAEYKLEDGSVIRFAAPAMSVVRIDGEWDAQGDPVYLIASGASTTVISAGAGTRRPEPEPPKGA